MPLLRTRLRLRYLRLLLFAGCPVLLALRLTTILRQLFPSLLLDGCRPAAVRPLLRLLRGTGFRLFRGPRFGLPGGLLFRVAPSGALLLVCLQRFRSPPGRGALLGLILASLVLPFLRTTLLQRRATQFLLAGLAAFCLVLPAQLLGPLLCALLLPSTFHRPKPSRFGLLPTALLLLLELALFLKRLLAALFLFLAVALLLALAFQLLAFLLFRLLGLTVAGHGSSDSSNVRRHVMEACVDEWMVPKS